MNETAASAGKKKALLIKGLKIGGPILLLVFIGIQFVPVAAIEASSKRSAMKGEDPQVVALLKRSCYDCHSNETEWPWYSRVAPASWLVAKDVAGGRESVNFSNWDDMDAFDKQYAREQAHDLVKDGDMPPWFYIPMHPSAKTNDQDLTVLAKWVKDHEDDEDEEEADSDEKNPEGETAKGDEAETAQAGAGQGGEGQGGAAGEGKADDDESDEGEGEE